jgi:cytochrome b6-f complex iron-sulfur subunit
MTEADAQSQPRSRREFIANLVLGAGALLGLGGLAARFASFLYPVVPPVKLVEVIAGKRAEIPKGGAKLFNLPQGRVMIVENDTQLRAFSAICTHLGCVIRWEDDVKRFHCPCHHGWFDTNGKVVSGPPPRPLDEIKVEVRGDDVVVFLETREEETA